MWRGTEVKACLSTSLPIPFLVKCLQNGILISTCHTLFRKISLVSPRQSYVRSVLQRSSTHPLHPFRTLKLYVPYVETGRIQHPRRGLGSLESTKTMYLIHFGKFPMRHPARGGRRNPSPWCRLIPLPHRTLRLPQHTILFTQRDHQLRIFIVVASSLLLARSGLLALRHMRLSMPQTTIAHQSAQAAQPPF